MGNPFLAALPPPDTPLGRVRRRFRRAVTWSRLFRATSYVRSALWLIPLVAMALVLALAPPIRALDRALEWKLTNLGVDGAQSLCGTVITLTLSFVVFTFGSLLVALQVAGGQLTPRIIATALLRDNVVRYSVGLFVFTLIAAVVTQNRLTTHVPQLLVFLIALLGIASITVFLFFIDYAARLLRPVSVVARIGDEGLNVLDAVYPAALPEGGRDPSPTAPSAPLTRELLHDGTSGVVLAIDIPALIEAARRTDGVVELAPQVGDFLAYGQPLFRLYGGAASIDDRTLEGAVALGPERTIEQDPMFALRILVDIALKALSPAINDPTTAVLALDQVHRLLRITGQRELRCDAIRDADGALRLALRTPDWHDFVEMACVEIRGCGAGSVQVARRLTAMLEDLLAVLPPVRHPPLQAQRALLQRALEASFPFPEDLALARVPDVQGMGGAPHDRRPRS